MEMANGITELSEAVKTSFLDKSMELTLVQTKGIRSLMHLRVNLAGFTTITKETFPFIMSDVVVAKVVDLLLM
jgi:hypothetical protein